MSKIKILPEDLANKIAAGEVVERPASVVKEFVENGLDAKASHITVEVEGGGTRLLRVIDNGEGMDADDVLLCLERHATSKLKEAADLNGITTLGFRGEAVPSIASVSQLVITSKRPGAELGTLAEIRYGQVRKVHEMGCSQGTVMEVRDLFGNVPARRKFLKTKRTELSHVEEVVLCAALAHPEVGFRLVVDGREVLSFASGDSLEHRVATLFGQKKPGSLLAIDWHKYEDGGEIAVHGWLLSPDVMAGPAGQLRLFVLGRPVRDRMVSHAVSEGAHGYYMKGRRPAGVIMVSTPLAEVDVNVHPTKQEIRFRQANVIHQAVVEAVRTGLERYQGQVKKALFGTFQPRPSRPVAPQTREPAAVGQEPLPQPVSLFPSCREKKSVLLSDDGQALKTSPPASPAQPHSVQNDPVGAHRPDFDSMATSTPSGLNHINYIGQYQDSYLLCASNEGLVVIDQHAAHERLLFEKLKKQLASRTVARQTLLFPEMVECTAAQIQALHNHHDEIVEMGLEVAEFGGETFVIKAIPALLAYLGPLEIFSGIIDQYVAPDISASRATRLEDVLATMACKAAVKANHVLQPEEGMALVEQMLTADVFSHCPHGRPVYRLFSPDEVKKWFKRT
ncbi:MAG: DNA mismatch repair endonuclease MutL [Proteobacteria bacterium]|nr:DNA mismatch repair endonuclease MutL [Pseudomonadota bacterium]